MATRQPPVHQQPLTLGPDDAGRLVSADEFAEAEYIDPWEYEREDGRLVIVPPHGQEHVEAAHPWLLVLFTYRALHPELVQLVVPNVWVRIDEDTDRIVDYGVYLAAKGPVPQIPDRVPDLMFEVVSPENASGECEYVEKRAEYERLGVREYVIIDSRALTLTVLTQSPGGYVERVLTVGDTYTSPLLPGLVVPLAEVFPG